MFEATGQGDQAPESFANALVANPLNLQARYASIRGYLDVLSRGEAPEISSRSPRDSQAPRRPRSGAWLTKPRPTGRRWRRSTGNWPRAW